MKGLEIAKVIGWTCFGITLTIMYFGMFSTMALSNINSEIRTYHKIDMDNQTKDAIMYLSEISKHQTEKEFLYCENKLLNQSLYYEKLLAEQELHYQSYCRTDDGGFLLDCWN